MQTFADILADPRALAAWGLVVLAALAILARDLRGPNAATPSLMKLVWALTVLYSGPVGLAVYWWSGRAQIPRDSLPRRAFRSVAHCYSGCGMGEVAGLLLSVGLLGMATPGVVAVTFACAWIAGFWLTVGPMMQGGTPFAEAARDAAIAETPSIAVMEAVAIGVDLSLAGSAGPGQALFWSSMAVSLSAGLFAAWPVNALLIAAGVKSGMADPREGGAAHCH